MRFETISIHGGQEPDPATGAIMTPIYLSSTFVQSFPGIHKGYEYSRTKNPTRTALERNLAALEDAKYGLAFSSGMAAINTVMNLLKSGDHVVSVNDLYGGTYRLFSKLYSNYGIEFDFVDATILDEVENTIKKNTKIIWLESPTNPLLKLCDIESISRISKKYNIFVVMDNTFATPYLQRPLDLGADISLYSTTKYLGGHSDIIGGAIVTNRDDLFERLSFFQNAVGAIPSPFDSWLVLRGIKTLSLRMEKHSGNGMIIAQYLESHPSVEKVNYPGLPSHPQFNLAKKQMKDFGGIISFELKHGGMDEAKKFVSSTKIFSLAESLGGVESLIEHPASMTHASIPEKERVKSGLSNKLIRISVGIEHSEDLIEDLDLAFKKISNN
ncbi:MAG: cystathionine gamma-synthase [Acidobacteriota bacterium]